MYREQNGEYVYWCLGVSLKRAVSNVNCFVWYFSLKLYLLFDNTFIRVRKDSQSPGYPENLTKKKHCEAVKWLSACNSTLCTFCTTSLCNNNARISKFRYLRKPDSDSKFFTSVLFIEKHDIRKIFQDKCKVHFLIAFFKGVANVSA